MQKLSERIPAPSFSAFSILHFAFSWIPKLPIWGLLICAAPLPAQFVVQEDAVVLNAPDEVDLQILVDFIGQTLGVRFLYGEELAGKKVQLRPSPIELPKARLLDLLTSLLRVRDLALVEERVGLYRIVTAEQVTRGSVEILAADAAADPNSMRLVTQALRVPPERVADLAEQLARFTSTAKGSVLPVAEQGLLLVTDYESRLAVLQELVNLLITGGEVIQVRTIAVRADPRLLATQIAGMADEAHRMTSDPGLAPSIRGDLVPGSLVVTGTAEQIEQVQRWIETLSPVQRSMISKAYTPRFLDVEEAKQLITNVVLAPGSGVPAPAHMYADRSRSRLHVTAEEQTHQAIARLLAEDDRQRPEPERPLRTYRPLHRRVEELLPAIVQLLGEAPVITPEEKPLTPSSPGSDSKSQDRASAPSVIQLPPKPPDPSPAGAAAPPPLLRVEGADFVVSADEATNTILAVGTREFHSQLATLIEALDIIRPQVLIEMKLIAVTTSDTLDVGFEATQFDFGEAWDFLTFSAFGLSSVDVVNGQRVLTPGVGANGILLSPTDEAFIFRALATKANGRIISSPKILVADNARGVLRNVDEAPFTSVNASDTVATTSFAGFESAGTTLSVTPHILEGDKLALDYELSFSNFSGSSSAATVPPPRTTNSFTSLVEVPDGYTVVTGGLVVDNSNDSLSEVPLLGDIPGLGLLFQNTSRQKTQTRVYAFIKPIILREDQFEQLKFISLKESHQAGIKSESIPADEPLWME